MDPTAKAIFFGAAVLAFVVEAIRSRSILAGGLAAFATPYAWDAIEQA